MNIVIDIITKFNPIHISKSRFFGFFLTFPRYFSETREFTIMGTQIKLQHTFTYNNNPKRI